MSASISHRLCRGWDQFWHVEQSPSCLGIFRILFGICLIKEIETTRAKSTSAIVGDFHLPYCNFIQPVPEAWYDWMHHLQYPFAMLLALGLFMRSSCTILLVLQGYIYFTDHLNFRNHPYFFMLVLLLLLFSPADEAFSFKSYVRAAYRSIPVPRALTGPLKPVTFQRLIQVQICIAYLFAGYHKLHPHFLDGHVLAAQMTDDFENLKPILSHWVTAAQLTVIQETITSPEGAAWPSRAAAFLEFFLPVALWFRRLRLPAILLGIGFHLSIALSMNIHVFSYAMIGSYFLFLDQDHFAQRVQRTLANLSGKTDSGEAIP